MSIALLLLLDVAFILHLSASARQLPDRVASHFQPNGDADLWIGRRKYAAIIAAMGPGVSLVWLGLFLFFRNPPLHTLVEHLAWAGCLLLAFIFAVHWLTVRANRQAEARLSMPLFWSFFLALQLGIVAWVVAFPKI